MQSNKFLVTSIVVCFTLLVIYEVAVRLVLINRPAIAENQWSSNVIKAEEFLYGTDSPSTVIVGSSLSYRLQTSFFTWKISNLAFAAKSSIEGLLILDRGGYAPSLVLIETNVLNYPPDSGFVDRLYFLPTHGLKNFIFSLRERFRPISDLNWTVYYLSRKITSTIFSYFQANASPNEHPELEQRAPQQGVDSELYSRLVDYLVSSRTSLPGQADMNNSILLLKRLVDDLQRRGSKVVFFELPADPRVCSAPRSVYLREVLHDAFPAHEYTFLPKPICEDYQTTDGIHLPPGEAERFARDLTQQLVIRGLAPHDL